MFQNNNFIALHDLSTTALILWTSPSILDCLGYDPEEVIGVSPYSWIHPDDIEGCRVAHKETLVNEIAGTQLFFRMKRKDGRYSPFVVFSIICYHYVVACFTLMNQEDDIIRKVTSYYIVHSAAMASLMGSEKEELERISRNHKNVSSTWNPAKLDMELRACLFLNRFTRNLCVMYASPSCEMVLDLDPDDLLGKPLLLYIRADDLASFVAQADLAKSTATVRHLRFWFQSPNRREEIPLEAIFLGAADALVAVFRRCLPFRRKQFITNFSSQEYFTRRNSGKFNQNYNFSSRSSRSRGSSFERSEPYGRIRHVYSVRDSPTDTFSSSSSSISSTQNQSTQAYQASPQNVPVGSISSIRSLDKEQTRLRPLASFHEEETDVLKSKAKYLLRDFRTQDSEVETCLVEEFEKVRLVPDRTKTIRRERSIEEEEHSEEEDDDYYDEVPEITIPDESIEEILMPYSMRRHWKEE